MALPADLTTLNFSGKYVLSKALSDSTDEMLRLQGINMIKRTLIGAATITLHLKHFKDDQGVEHIHIAQMIQGGVQGPSEIRALNWEEQEDDNMVYGTIVGRARRVTPDEIDASYLKEGFTPDTLENGLIHTYTASDLDMGGVSTWSADMTWGIEVIGGERRYVRHVKLVGTNGEDHEARMVYDYSMLTFLVSIWYPDCLL
ncbi:hypothetical protein FISHEDRAFT_43316 [Fistulina hepatica ATCC 64428]|uniref:Uncharacterized protein n=1 Tax=Fistulina hepatica ATCC 64428 TaxID=1128425 RepID=A0A0D7AEX2_9AGAR|nr:hypothetical protein FISHEDRAFT_43316 [Fistulina hepatica ATCC 64428]